MRLTAAARPIPHPAGDFRAPLSPPFHRNSAGLLLCALTDTSGLLTHGMNRETP